MEEFEANSNHPLDENAEETKDENQEEEEEPDQKYAVYSVQYRGG